MNNSESRLTCSMSNGVIAFLLIAALLVPIRAIAESEQHAVARKYAALVGRLALTESLFSEMSQRCDVDFAYTTQQYSAIDYHLRIHTGMSFNQWQAQFGDAEQSNAMVEQVMNDTLRDIGECNPEGLQQWFAGMQQNLVGPSVDELTSLPLVFGLRARSVSEQEAVAFFRSQVLAYKTLSTAEIVGLAHGLSTGGYHYAKMVYLPNIQVDHQKAVTLYEFAYQQEASAENLFALAQGKARVDRDASVPLFKQAAEEGLFEAQRWYGNYLGCQGNKPDALFWLQQAKDTNPEQAEFIDDFIIEINELGEPTNCLDGWVHQSQKENTMSDRFYSYQVANGHGLPHDPFKAIIAPRPIGWIASKSLNGVANLAPYSFFNAFNNAPPIIGFASVGYKDSVKNIKETGEFCWSMATQPLAEAMNNTSKPVAEDVCEFELAGLEQGAPHQVNVPFVAASPVSMECKLTQIVQLTDTAQQPLDTWVVFGQVVAVHIAHSHLKDGAFQLVEAQPIMRAGGPGDYFSISAENGFFMGRPKQTAAIQWVE